MTTITFKARFISLFTRLGYYTGQSLSQGARPQSGTFLMDQWQTDRVGLSAQAGGQPQRLTFNRRRDARLLAETDEGTFAARHAGRRGQSLAWTELRHVEKSPPSGRRLCDRRSQRVQYRLRR